MRVRLGRYTLFIVIIAVTLLLSYIIRGFIEAYYTYLYTKTMWPLYRYLIPVVTALVIGLFIDILFDIYMVLFNRRLLGDLKAWLKSLIPNYALLLSTYYGVYTAYYLLVDNLLRNYRVATISGFQFPSLFATIVLLVSLTYIGTASIKYLMLRRQEYRRLNILKKFYKTMELFWSNKGTFIIWVFIGFLVTGLIGVVSETLLCSVSMGHSGLFQIVIVISIVINTVVLYPYYTYFINNYIIDLIISLRKTPNNFR